MSGHVDIAKTLIQYSADVDVMVNAFNFLGIAIMSDNSSIVDLILSCSTGIDEYDCEGRTPLRVALGNSKYESARFLLEKRCRL